MESLIIRFLYHVIILIYAYFLLVCINVERFPLELHFGDLIPVDEQWTVIYSDTHTHTDNVNAIRQISPTDHLRK